MRWLLFSYESDAIVKQIDDLLQVVGQTVIHEHHQGKSTIQEIQEKINHHKPNRIIVIVNEQNSENTHSLTTTLTDHLLIPLFITQATINTFPPVPVLLLTFTTENKLTDPNSSINIVQNATDELIKLYSHIINVKLFTPISDEDLKEDILLTKLKSLWEHNPEEYHHITILSDVLPILLAILHDGKITGQIDVCNKGTISLKCFEQLISKQVKKDLTIHPNNINEDLIDNFEKWNKQMISPETRHLYQASFIVPNAEESLHQYLQQKSIQLSQNKSKIILVTGGCGFIGSTFINHWLETYSEDRIINIDRLDPVSNLKNVQNSTSSNYSLIVADINNKDIVLHLMKQYNITHIVHFAVQAHLDNTFGNSVTFTESNVYGTHSVLEAARIYGKIQKFIHISTDEVYGETAAGSYQETNLLNPLNPYAATIAAAEFLVKSYGESFKLLYCIVRLSNVYGPRQHFEKIIPAFINNLLKGEKLKIHGDGSQTRLYIYVEDVIRAIETILHKGKTRTIYNIGGENELSVIDIAKKLLKKLQPDKIPNDVITYDEGRAFTEKRYSTTSTSGAIKSLGWKTNVSFDEGLNKTIQWYKEHQDYWIKDDDKIV
ncbi:unnamed protein product [Adineta steineri]|uniref:dTDP-D-glucose 4,6-dehydratase n=1 Tax=Adineta steineri TaxID=433720 RepID=A0A818NYT6_9BILA|nr:unnamed protein product [Adineta steineri]CAF3614598.1 unnamed protein product [Adineta steineri]